MEDKTFPHSLYVLLIQSGMPEGLTTEQQTKWLHRHLRGLNEQNTDLLDALRELVEANERWNKSVEQVIGKHPNWSDSYLDAARAAIAKAEGTE